MRAAKRMKKEENLKEERLPVTVISGFLGAGMMKMKYEDISPLRPPSLLLILFSFRSDATNAVLQVKQPYYKIFSTAPPRKMA